VDWLTAKVGQTGNKRTEADLTRKCGDIAVLLIHRSCCKCEHSRSVFQNFLCHKMISCFMHVLWVFLLKNVDVVIGDLAS